MLRITDDTPDPPVRPDASAPEALLTDLHVLGGVAADLQLAVLVRDDVVAAGGAQGHSSSRGIAVGRSTSRIGALAGEAGWRPVTSRTARVWTDNFSNIWSVLWR